MSESEDPLLQSCPNCVTLIDISEQEPFEQIHCPSCGTALRARTQIKNFTLQEILGAGGMGAVYKALDLNLNRHVALKVVRKELSSDQEYLDKFEREALITASVNHPHVVKVFSFGQDHGLFYIAMELVDKGSLDDLMNLQSRVAEAQVLEVGVQIAQGLHAAHERGLIHRDVKPGNILFADAHTAKIVDFGLALLMEHEAESRGEVWGTPYYVAPEKLNHEPEDFRSDIYSLGGTLFHALAGRPPFEAETASMVALKHMKSQAVSLQAFAPDISSATAYVINRMLHKDPDSRYQSYEELVEHLQYARAQLLEAGANARQKTRVVVETKEQQRVMGWITVGLLALFLIAGALLFLFRDRVFHDGDARAAAQEQAALQNASQRYDTARQQLIGGDPAAAYETLHGIVEDTAAPIPQPMRNWIAYHEGLAALLAGQTAAGQAAFKKLKDRGLYTNDPAERPMAQMFVEVGSAMSEPGLVQPGGSKFKPNDATVAGLLAAGIKNWQLGNVEEAAPFLRAFAGAKPQGAVGFLADYQPIVRRHLSDYEAYKAAAAKINSAKTANEAAAAMQAIQEARRKAQTKGTILIKLRDLESALKRKVSASSGSGQQPGGRRT
jgi:hypothetical protein